MGFETNTLYRFEGFEMDPRIASLRLVASPSQFPSGDTQNRPVGDT
jgi:hypothetical protein